MWTYIEVNGVYYVALDDKAVLCTIENDQKELVAKVVGILNAAAKQEELPIT